MNGKTKLSEALKASPEVLEFIISLAPHDFARLRNPLMQKVMPARISLGRIARMVKMPEQELVDKLNALAGLPHEQCEATELRVVAHHEIPDWLHTVDDADIRWVDVTPLDEVLGDPMPPINIAVNALKPGETLGIKHKWEPQPLFDIWTARGLKFWTDEQHADLWHIYVHRPL